MFYLCIIHKNDHRAPLAVIVKQKGHIFILVTNEYLALWIISPDKFQRVHILGKTSNLSPSWYKDMLILPSIFTPTAVKFLMTYIRLRKISDKWHEAPNIFQWMCMTTKKRYIKNREIFHESQECWQFYYCFPLTEYLPCFSQDNFISPSQTGAFGQNIYTCKFHLIK